MRSFKIFSTILLIFSLSLFSCQPEEPFEKIKLSQTKLLEVIESMPEFQAYSQTMFQTYDAIMRQREVITEKESNWVANIHEKFPTLSVLRASASERVMLRYQELTNIHVMSGNKVEKKQLQDLLASLDTQYIYQASDLSKILLTLNSPTKLEKDWVPCSSMCFIESSMEYNQVLMACNRERIEPIPGEDCRSTASDAMRYYFRGCLSGCSQSE